MENDSCAGVAKIAKDEFLARGVTQREIENVLCVLEVAEIET